ncbi:hypothetical protein Tsubulata_042362 [Turnera subulata]|uniref:Rapid ALkalinization Factor n=1 Tax=Turnera subulata TaxID=218843 RepID=A0A9Q0FFS6_9ROSI|nr:hypothetical protein Tsubulata_042362 [Turnera subulata]
MAKHFTLVLFFSLAAVFISTRTQAQVDEATAAGGLKILTTDAMEWPASMVMYTGLQESTGFDDGLSDLEDDDGDGVEGNDGMVDRRSLFWRRAVHYYISYGALSANRIPCPPRSGRSYYTHNCFKNRRAVNPYTRGCSRITRCRR